MQMLSKEINQQHLPSPTLLRSICLDSRKSHFNIEGSWIKWMDLTDMFLMSSIAWLRLLDTCLFVLFLFWYKFEGKVRDASVQHQWHSLLVKLVVIKENQSCCWKSLTQSLYESFLSLWRYKIARNSYFTTSKRTSLI